MGFSVPSQGFDSPTGYHLILKDLRELRESFFMSKMASRDTQGTLLNNISSSLVAVRPGGIGGLAFDSGACGWQI